MDSGLGRTGRARLALLALAGMLGWLALGWRFHDLMIRQHDVSLRRARLNTVVPERSAAGRGRLFDRRGRMLVGNQPTTALVVRPAELKKGASALIAQALGLPKASLEKRIQRGLKAAPLEPMALAHALDSRQLARAAVLFANGQPGVDLEPASHRRYPYGKLAADVLGYMGEISEEELQQLRKRDADYSARDMVGKSGLEARYDALLRGRKGVEEHAVDALGRTVEAHQGRSPLAGPDLHLTLDLDLQREAEELLAANIHPPHGGAVVVMNPQSGALLALASAPHFDPRPFARGIRDREYAALLKDPSTPLLGRSYQCAFSPGSTFKLVTSSAGLAEKLCSPGSTFYCGGSYKGHNCFVTSGHGQISFAQSLAVSCDVTYYRMAESLGIWKLARYARAYGLGRPTGVDLAAEDGGLFPDPVWKRRVYREPWENYDIINIGVGQGMLVVTPLQMAVVCSAVANGGRVYRPYLVDRVLARNGGLRWKARPRPVRRVPIAPRLLAAVREGMRGAVTYGTAGACNLPDLAVSGKTGTVETNGENHTWFVSFAPSDRPSLVIVVFLEKTGGFGGSKAAPIARRLYQSAFHLKKDAQP